MGQGRESARCWLQLVFARRFGRSEAAWGCSAGMRERTVVEWFTLLGVLILTPAGTRVF